MSSGGNMLEEAAGGSCAAQLALVDSAIEAGKTGAVRQLEALIAAETWARLAAANGSGDERRALVRVLLAREEFELDRARLDNAQAYKDEACRVLGLMAAEADEAAQRMLSELARGDAVQHGSINPLDQMMSAAARGDMAALGELYDFAMGRLIDGDVDPLEPLVVGELYARLGSAVGDADHMRRLAGVMLKRAEYEYQFGWSALADSAVTEATVLLSLLVDGGDTSLACWLRILANEASRQAIAPAAQLRPSILSFIEPEGTC